MSNYTKFILACGSAQTGQLEDCGIAVGGIGSTGNLLTTAIKFSFSTQTGTRLLYTLDRPLMHLIGINSKNKGYFIGGLAGIYAVDCTHCLNYSTNTLDYGLFSVVNNMYGSGSYGLNSHTKGYTSGITVDSVNIINYSQITDITFATDHTNTLTLSLNVTSLHGSTLSSNTNGYLVNNGKLASNLQRLNFASEATSLVNISLKNPATQSAGAASVEKGYWMGFSYLGNTTSLNKVDTVDGIRFADETNTPVVAKTAVNSQSRYPFMSATRGYSVTGSGAGVVNSGIEFKTEVTLDISINSDYTSGAGAVSKYTPVRSLKGYFSGGSDYIGATIVLSNSLDLIDFNVLFTASLSNVLSERKCGHSGVEASKYDKGYFYGGLDTSGSYTNTAEVISFTDNSVSPITTWTSAKKSLASSLTSEEKGYFIGGELVNESGISLTGSTEAVMFTTDTISSNSFAILFERKSAMGASSVSEGYILGGNTGTNSQTIIEGIDYSTESSIINGQVLSIALESGSTLNNSASLKSYIVCGRTLPLNTLHNHISAINFVTDGAVSTVSSYIESIYNAAGVYSDTKGFIGGGVSSTENSIKRMGEFTFITETSSSIAVTLSDKKSQMAAVSDNKDNYDYFSPVITKRGLIAGGETGLRSISVIDGIEFTTGSSIISSASTESDYTCGVSAPTKGYLLGDQLRNLSCIIYNTDTLLDLGSIIPTFLEVATTSLNSSDEGFILYRKLVSGILKAFYGIIEFITNSMSESGLGLNLSRVHSAGLSLVSYGCIFGGYALAGSVITSVKTISGIAFSTRTNIEITQVLSRNVSNAMSVNSADYMYIYKGCSFINAPSSTSGTTIPIQYTDCLLIQIPTLTSAVLSLSLSQDSTAVNGGCLNSSTFGYMCENGGSLIVAIHFATDTIQTVDIALTNRNNLFNPPACVNYNY